ncbi:MAG: preprotein translocase subunit SecG [bacterium]|nr:preprotein translocase subunit SecG [bacterium]
MDILVALLYVVEVVVCLLLALVVMLQKPKEGGLGGLAGGMGEAVFGADAGNVLIKVTVWLGAIFLVNTLLLARFTSKSHAAESAMAGVEQQQAPKEALPNLNTQIDPEKLAADAAKAPAAAAPAKPEAPKAPVAAAPAKPEAPKAPAVPAPEKPAAPKAN